MTTFKGFNIQGHRCFGSEEVENTFEAFQAAAKSELHSIETDVFLSSDLVPFICHCDSSFGVAYMRPTDQPDAEYKIVAFPATPAEELDKLTYKQNQGRPLQRMEALLKVFKGTNKILNMEIKELQPCVS